MDESLSGPKDEVTVGENGLLLPDEVKEWEFIS